MAETAQSPTSRLDAVNEMLATIGLRPVNSLVDIVRHDVSEAVRALDRTSRRTQMAGWWFNRRTEQDLAPDGTGAYIIPDEWEEVELTYPSTSHNFTVEAGVLRDLVSGDDDGFTDTIQINYIEIKPFESLPEAARWYIGARARNNFVISRVGASALLREARAEVREAWAALMRKELRHTNANLADAPEVAKTMRHGLQ